MFYENELRLLCDTFKKCHVRASVLSPDDIKDQSINQDIFAIFGHSVYERITRADERTMYKYIDRLGCRYIYLRLPSSGSHILLVGPYVTTPFSQKSILELGEKLGISPKSTRNFEEYCRGIPVIAESNSLLVLLDTFCERIWSNPSFAISDEIEDTKLPVSPINESAHTDNFDDVLVNMKTMERRYDYENELIRAVTLGQRHKESILLSSFGDMPFERRTADPVRNAKNYGIIMNTLLRKAAENGGVHPVYLDRVSSEFAFKLEQMSSTSEIKELMSEMFRSYCRLVRKHSMKSYSAVVQKAILLIDSDLAADLSLSSLAANQSISPGYLSTIFKKETGKTVSEYIRDKRIKHATHLLSTTHLQIQTVALHCGIMDVQYFSKVFKKQTGMTPKEYRDSIK